MDKSLLMLRTSNSCTEFRSSRQSKNNTIPAPSANEGDLSSSEPSFGKKRIDMNVLKSKNIFIEGFTFSRNQVYNHTDGCRTQKGFISGAHAFEICWPPSLRGSNACVGVCTSLASMKADGYVSLIGSNLESWGFDISRRILLHNGKSIHKTINPSFPETACPEHGCIKLKDITIPEQFFMILDMDSKTVSFAADGILLGQAFVDLQETVLYPAMSAVYGNCQVKFTYLGDPKNILTDPELISRTSSMEVVTEKVEAKPKVRFFKFFSCGLFGRKKKNKQDDLDESL